MSAMCSIKRAVRAAGLTCALDRLSEPPQRPRHHRGGLGGQRGDAGWNVQGQHTRISGSPLDEGPVADVRTSHGYLLAPAAQHCGVGI